MSAEEASVVVEEEEMAERLVPIVVVDVNVVAFVVLATAVPSPSEATAAAAADGCISSGLLLFMVGEIGNMLVTRE